MIVLFFYIMPQNGKFVVMFQWDNRKQTGGNGINLYCFTRKVSPCSLHHCLVVKMAVP